jgi:aminopeptidase N
LEPSKKKFKRYGSKYIYFIHFIILCQVINSCRSNKKTDIASIVTKVDTINNISIQLEEPYNPSKTKFWDLINTKLDVSFDWKNCLVIGKASIILKPHFYSTNTLSIDAVGFTLNDVSMLNGNIKTKDNLRH